MDIGFAGRKTRNTRHGAEFHPPALPECQTAPKSQPTSFMIAINSNASAIVSVLSEMDAELALLEQRGENTRALKQAMMQELLTGRTRLV